MNYRKVLVVDDEKTDRALVRRQLRDYEVFEVETYETALGLLEDGDIGVVVSDTNSKSETNGFTFCAGIKISKPDIIFLGMSGIDPGKEIDYRELYEINGADGFFIKGKLTEGIFLPEMIEKAIAEHSDEAAVPNPL
ncbi:MAG: response regulator [Candidatus Aenigmarchaeota archaeon]|nr:response regulator [Candidatus Aenigmarchaeota archaeon]